MRDRFVFTVVAVVDNCRRRVTTGGLDQVAPATEAEDDISDGSCSTFLCRVRYKYNKGHRRHWLFMMMNHCC